MGPCRTCGPRRSRPHPSWRSRPARDYYRKHLGGGAIRHGPVPARRPDQARCSRAGPYEAHSFDSRAPLMARVSFAAVKRIAITIGWVALFTGIAVGVTIGLSELVPGWGGRDWFVARTGACEVIGFGLATLIVGRWLKALSWAQLGWRGAAFPKLFVGVGLGALMAAVAVGLAVLLDGARVHGTGDLGLWARGALPL